MTNLTASDNNTTTSDSNDDLFSEVALHKIHHEGRDITYSTSPNATRSLPPVLFFYPGGGNRRMISSFRNLFSDLHFISVNRPSKGGTSPATRRGAEAHLMTAVQDCVAVLDELGIEKVSLMCMCAGTPFCFKFASTYPDRTTGQLTGISSWVQPADCGYENTKLSLYLGKTLRPVVAPVAGLVFASIGIGLNSFPTSMTTGALRSGLSEDEREAFDEKQTDTNDFAAEMKWVQQESGGAGRDMSVLLSGNLIDYRAVADSQKSIVLWHGTNDKTAPFESAQWLASDEALPEAVLNVIPDGTHNGCNFLLHLSIVDSVKTLGRQ